MSKEAMKLALEVLKINLTLLKKINPYKGQEDLLSDSLGLTNKAITTLEAELAKPDFWEGYVPEPDKRQQALDKKAENARGLGLDYEPVQQEPVFTYDQVKAHIQAAMMSAAQRTWVGLTDEDYRELHLEMGPTYFYQDYGRAIEAKLKEKNQ